MSDQLNTQYGQEKLPQIPTQLNPWNMRIERSQPSVFGEYVLVAMEPASIEQHHQVEVVDEDGTALAGVWVIFGYPGGSGPQINLQPNLSHWFGAPAVLIGNAQKTGTGGSVEHTFASGGEDIWVWDLDGTGQLLYSSWIVKNCTWQRPPVGQFNHTGVKLRFQRRRVGIKPMRQRLAELETVVYGDSTDQFVWGATLPERLAAIEQAVFGAE